MNTRSELVQLLAKVLYRRIVQQRIHTPQNLAPPGQDCLDVLPKEVLSVSNTVNTSGEQGDS